MTKITYPVTGEIVIEIDGHTYRYEDVDEIRYDVREGILPEDVLESVCLTVGTSP